MEPLTTVAVLVLLTGLLYLAMWRAGHKPLSKPRGPRDRSRDWHAGLGVRVGPFWFFWWAVVV